MKPRRQQLTQAEKAATFREMAMTFQSAEASGNYIAAHVIAFSYLEDRVTAMDVVRCRIASVREDRHAHFTQRVERLQYAGDLSPDFARRLCEAAKTRNKLFHQAMWELSGFSAKRAKEVYELARLVDNERRKQKRKLHH